ncbi:MAG: hypothetical protein LBU84_10705 [Prevotella sp.]|jgi:ABC-type dipeptide/oligopeptide/nickel transport system ATPase component|nr:hypothetical protein [Prevotella sp.]
MNTNNELIFSIGEETRPKIDKIDDLETSFFHEVYKKAFKLVNEMLADFEKNKNKIKGDYYQESRNNIIGFVGERGSGKTSCLQSVYQCLTAETGEIFGYKYKDFLSLPTIDPSYFEASNNILEIIIANMFLAFKEDARKNPQSIVNSSGDDNAHYLQKKKRTSKKISNS